MSLEKAYFSASPEGVLSIGNQIIKLEDESSRTFETDSLKAFEEFLPGHEDGAEIYYTDTFIFLVPVAVKRNTKPLASCTLGSSPALSYLTKNVGKDLDIASFETLLTALRKYAIGSHLAVISNLRAFTVAKKQTYERSLDNKGNFKLLTLRESAQGDWTPPDQLSFSLPLFVHVSEAVEINCDLVFSVLESGQPNFRLENLTFGEEVLARRVEVLEARLGRAATCPKYWGRHAETKADNSWKYRENKASL